MHECILVLDNLRSIENVGSIFRTADGFGVKKIILVGTTPTPLDRFGRKRQDFAKVALGAEDNIEWEHTDDFKNDGYKIIVLEQDPRAKRLRDFTPPDKFALVVGSEVNGVSKEIIDQADTIIEIPMMGEKESLNVAVATGVALFRFLGS